MNYFKDSNMNSITIDAFIKYYFKSSFKSII